MFKPISGSGCDPAGPDPKCLQKPLKASCDRNFCLRYFKFYFGG